MPFLSSRLTGVTLRRLGASLVAMLVAAHLQIVPAQAADDVLVLPNAAACVAGHQIDYRQTFSYGRYARAEVQVKPCENPESADPDRGTVTLLRADTGDILASGASGPTNIDGTYWYETVSLSTMLATFDATFPVEIRWTPLGSSAVSLDSTIVSSSSDVTLEHHATTFHPDGSAELSYSVVASVPGILWDDFPPPTGTVAVASEGTVLGSAPTSPHTERRSTVTVSLPRATDGARYDVRYSGDENYPPAETTVTVVDGRSTPSLVLSTSEHYGTVTVTARLTATHPHVLIPAGEFRLLVDGKQVATMPYPKAGSAWGSSLPTSVSSVTDVFLTGGPHDVTVAFDGNSAFKPVTVTTRTVVPPLEPTLTPVPSATRAPVDAGQQFTLTYQVTDMFARPLVTPVTLQYRTPGTSTWRGVRTSTPSATGKVAFAVSQRSTRYYRLVAPSSATSLAGKSPSTKVEVRRTVGLRRASTSVSSVVLEARVSPTGLVRFQERVDGSWVTRKSVRPQAATGTTGTVRMTATRTVRDRLFRAVVPADTAGLGATSVKIVVPRR